MKKLLSIILTAAIIICTCAFSAGAVVAPDSHMADISARLQEELADGSTDTVQMIFYLYDYSLMWEPYDYVSDNYFSDFNVDNWTDEDNERYSKCCDIVMNRWRAEYNLGFCYDITEEPCTPVHVDKVLFSSRKEMYVVVEAQKDKVNQMAKDYLDVESMDLFDGTLPNDEDINSPFMTDFDGWTYINHPEVFEYNLDDTGEDAPYTYTDLYVHNKDGKAFNPDWVLCQARYNAPEPEPMTVVKFGGTGGRTVIGTSIGSAFITGYGVYDVEKSEYYDLSQFADSVCPFFATAEKLPFDSSRYEGLTEAMKQLNIGYATGDGNYDNSVDVLDATLVQKAASEKANIYWQQVQTLDVNNDNKVDVLDANLIQKYAATVE